jgi:Ca2+-binding RTX toxin-like protein
MMSDIITVNGGTIPSNFSTAASQAAFANFFNSNVIVSEVYGSGNYTVTKTGPFPTEVGVTGTALAVTLSGADAIAISGVNDTVNAGDSTPYMAFLNGGTGITLNEGAGPSTVFASMGSATVNAGTGSTTVDGSTGNLTFTGGSSSNDSVTAGSGVTSMFGGSGGNNTLVGGSGWTMVTLTGSSSGDLAVGGTGVTTVQASNTTGNLTITTNPSGSGQMEIFMGSGADTFVGGGTTHTVVQAGSGADVFGFVNNGMPGADTILGFNAKDNVAFGSGLTVTGEAIGTYGDVITLSNGTTITLAGIDHKLW